MTIKDLLRADGGYTGWQGPIGIIPTSHAPSVKSPMIVKQDYPQDGWERGTSKAKRDKAKADLVQILDRLRNQPGRPTVGYASRLPIYVDSQSNP